MPSLESAFGFLVKYRRTHFDAGDVSIGAATSAPLPF